MNTYSKIDNNKDRKFDIFYLVEILNGFKFSVLFFVILFAIFSFLFYLYFAKSSKLFEIEIYKDTYSQSYNVVNNEEVFETFILFLKDYKIYKEAFKPAELSKSVFSSANYSSTQKTFKIRIPDQYMKESNTNDFNKFISLVTKKTIEKTILGLKKQLKKNVIEQEIIFKETNLFNLDKDYAKLRLGNSEIIAVVEKDFIREILDINVKIKLIEEDISSLEDQDNLSDFLLINLDSSIATISRPNLVIYLFLGTILGFIIGAIVAILRNDYIEYYRLPRQIK